MIDLDEESRALLALAREAEADNPSDVDRARVRAALVLRLGVASGVGGAAAVGSGAKVAAATGAGAEAGVTTVGALGAVAKLIGVAVVVSATVGVGATAIHRARQARVASLAAVAEAAPRSRCGSPAIAVTAPTRSEVSARREGLPQLQAPAPSPASAPELTPQEHEPKVAAPAIALWRSPRMGTSIERPRTAKEAVGGSPSPRPPSPAVAEEARLIHDGVVALRSGDPARALAAFDTHARLYPRGVLSEERDAERALALADLGRAADARAAVGQFLRVYPASPLAARLQERLARLRPR